MDCTLSCARKVFGNTNGLRSARSSDSSASFVFKVCKFAITKCFIFHEKKTLGFSKYACEKKYEIGEINILP